MSNYLKHKPGSIEEIVANQTNKFREDSGYQKMFKKELEKAGKGIGSMSPAEKKAFFNKIDKKYSAKDEGMETMVPNKKEDEKDMKRKVTMTGDKPSKIDTKPLFELCFLFRRILLLMLSEKLLNHIKQVQTISQGSLFDRNPALVHQRMDHIHDMWSLFVVKTYNLFRSFHREAICENRALE